MKKIAIIFGLMLACAAQAELVVDVTTATKGSLSNKDLVVTGVSVSGSAHLDTNTVEGAGVADLRFQNDKAWLKTKYPNLAGAEGLKGIMLMRLSESPNPEGLNYKDLPGTIVLNGDRYSILPIMSARTVDKKLSYKMPVWTTAEVNELPDITDGSTPEQLITGYMKMRQFLLDHSVSSLPTETAATVEDGPALIGGEPMTEQTPQ